MITTHQRADTMSWHAMKEGKSRVVMGWVSGAGREVLGRTVRQKPRFTGWSIRRIP
jgi:hypothetical protein